jgi:hypothetical protein
MTPSLPFHFGRQVFHFGDIFGWKQFRVMHRQCKLVMTETVPLSYSTRSLAMPARAVEVLCNFLSQRDPCERP